MDLFSINPNNLSFAIVSKSDIAAPFKVVIKTESCSSFSSSITIGRVLRRCFVAAGNTLSVDWGVDKKKIIRYCLGHAAGAADLTKADFATVLTWIGGNTVGNAVYTLEDL